ncbi:hypothetical protein HKD39_18120 [Nakamurella sp. DB0629]|uniref:tRNA (Uracil-5-)-methyltransferase n=2 Tax=Nakamurella aerolata TaxID=1656892 RepID=A0A849AGL0_9ACTN|nr:hypothetical protein [Nakamurella aerolata]NNG37580.1 hypothetical protein [Nakamurella aerolata]
MVLSGGPAELDGLVVTETVAGREFRVAADGFWQVHPDAAGTLTAAVTAALDTARVSGGTGWDLYGGVGVFAPALAAAVGRTGTVVSVEGDRTASALAVENLADLPQVRCETSSVETFVRQHESDTVRQHQSDTVREHQSDTVRQHQSDTVRQHGSDGGAGDPAVVVLDPPRSGAGQQVCTALAALRPRLIVYVACDPAALARDTKTLLDNGFRLTDLKAFDCFPQTHHVECVASFRPAATESEPAADPAAATGSERAAAAPEGPAAVSVPAEGSIGTA